MEITRQRRRQNITHVNFSKCPVCKGLGEIKSKQTLALEIFRNIKNKISRKGRRIKKKDVQSAFDITVHPKMFEYILNKMRDKLVEFEQENSISVNIYSSSDINMNEIRYK